MGKYIDTNMIITSIVEEKRKKIEETILGETYKVTEQVGVHIDKEKLKQWLEMCVELEKIDESQRIDDAIRNKFKEKDKEIQSLKHQLAEKDEELEELKDRLEYITENSNGVVQVFDITEHDKEIRHELCEEIREKIKNNLSVDKKFVDNNDYVNYYAIINWDKLKYILDQIEQGENKC